MAVKSQSVDNIVSKFLIKKLPQIDGEPTYESINEMMQILYANVATLSTTTGRGTHSHIGLIMKPELYQMLSHIPYAIPVDQSPIPQYAPGSSGLACQQVSMNLNKQNKN